MPTRDIHQRDRQPVSVPELDALKRDDGDIDVFDVIDHYEKELRVGLDRNHTEFKQDAASPADTEQLRAYTLDRLNKQLGVLRQHCFPQALTWFSRWVPVLAGDATFFLWDAAGLSRDSEPDESESTKELRKAIVRVESALTRRCRDFQSEADREWRNQRVPPLSQKFDLNEVRQRKASFADLRDDDLRAEFHWEEGSWRLCDGSDRTRRAFKKRADAADLTVGGVGLDRPSGWQRWLDRLLPDYLEWTAPAYGIGEIPRVREASAEFLDDLIAGPSIVDKPIRFSDTSVEILTLLIELGLIKPDLRLKQDKKSLGLFCREADDRRISRPQDWPSGWQRTLDRKSRQVASYLSSLVKRARESGLLRQLLESAASSRQQ